VVGRAEYAFSFPRQGRKPHRALSDFFRHERHDVLPITCVSAGPKFSAYEKELYDAGKYLEYNMVHGFSVELAEALAEVAHKQIRIDLDRLGKGEKPNLTLSRVLPHWSYTIPRRPIMRFDLCSINAPVNSFDVKWMLY